MYEELPARARALQGNTTGMSQVTPTPIQPKPVRTPKAKKGLRRASKERARQLRAYAILRPIYLRSHPYCMAFGHCSRRAREIHHTKGRAGELLCEDEWFIPICPRHHQWIHDHPNKARELGLLLF